MQPKVKVLACGEEGRGAMAEVEVRRRGGLEDFKRRDALPTFS